MQTVILIIQIIVAVLLSVLVLLQVKGTGFGRAWGGGGGANFSRRGLENFVFKLTFGVVGAFLTISILSLIL